MNGNSIASIHTITDDREKAIKEVYQTGSGLHTGEVVVSQEVLDQWNKMSLEEKTKF
jgi:hypothetical protein